MATPWYRVTVFSTTDDTLEFDATTSPKIQGNVLSFECGDVSIVVNFNTVTHVEVRPINKENE